MPILDFPDPTTSAIGDLFTDSGKTWEYDGTAWNLVVGPFELASNSVTSGKIFNGSVLENKLANSAVTTHKIANGAVTEPKLANGSVTSNKLSANAVTNSSISSASIDDSKIASDAAVSYTKLNLAFSVVNSDVSNSAGILPTKISGTAITKTDYSSKGILITASSAGNVTSLSAGTNGFLLSANSATVTGLEWVDAGPDSDQVIIASQMFA